jgi:hypothetical protein
LISALNDHDGYDSKSDSKGGRDEVTPSIVKKAMVEWVVNLGDNCRQIQTGIFLPRKDRSVAEDLLVLTDRSLFLIKDTGLILQQLRLEKDPVCIHAYRLSNAAGGKQDPSNFLVAYTDGTIQVYSEFALTWATVVQLPPVQLSVASFASDTGLIVTIADSGLLQIGYLGTKPPIHAVANQSRALDYDKVDEEHKVHTCWSRAIYLMR